MIEWFSGLQPVVQALLAGGFTWTLTALGAATVFLRRDLPTALLDATLGFAAGVMIAASYWSLLAPAVEFSAASRLPDWFAPAVGFVLGAGFLFLADQLLPHLHSTLPSSDAAGVETSWRRTTLLVFAIALHNIPEGLAVGVAFGAAAANLDLPGGATLGGAVALAVGIGLQNFPEGVAVAVPLRGEGVGRFRSFTYGQLSALVEPVFAVLGAAAASVMLSALPYALAFAAGAMIYVVVEELISTSQGREHGDLATLGVVFGFTVMMVLDVGLG